MSTSRSLPPSVKWLCLILGLLLLLGSLGLIGWDGYQAWGVWKVQHVKGAKPMTAMNLAGEMGKKCIGGPTGFVGAIVGFFAGIWLFQLANKKEGASLVAQAALVQAGQGQVPVVATEMVVTEHKPKRKLKAKRWTTANIISFGAESRRLLTFNGTRSGFTIGQQATIPNLLPLPAKVVGRDWRALLQPKLNIAWLPVDQVFLRVVQIPVSDFEETLSMVELQLEKISPLPVTQIVWSIHILPQQADNLQTVIVVMVARDIVEKYLGELEGQGFQADRLELPILDEILATRVAADGAYIYPENTPGKFSALVAWWYGGTLRSLGLVHVPAVDGRDAILKEQLAQMAWSGELEGWLSGNPHWFLVSNEQTAAAWQPMFRPWLGQSVEVIPPLTEADLATRNANRSGKPEAASGLLPDEFALRYMQEFHDRLWMRLVGALAMIYIAGVMIYMAASSWQGMSADDKERQARGLGQQYTNTLQIKAQVEILQNRQALKFASLDCWKTTAELQPAEITLGSLDFKDGKHLSLSGTASADANGQLTDFNEALRKKTKENGDPLFERVDLPSVRLNPGGATLSWSFSAVLANAEEGP